MSARICSGSCSRHKGTDRGALPHMPPGMAVSVECGVLSQLRQLRMINGIRKFLCARRSNKRPLSNRERGVACGRNSPHLRMPSARHMGCRRCVSAAALGDRDLRCMQVCQLRGHTAAMHVVKCMPVPGNPPLPTHTWQMAASGTPSSATTAA
eukprot:359258-Chlamydomonas_euryale.AAC.15